MRPSKLNRKKDKHKEKKTTTTNDNDRTKHDEKKQKNKNKQQKNKHKSKGKHKHQNGPNPMKKLKYEALATEFAAWMHTHHPSDVVVLRSTLADWFQQDFLPQASTWQTKSPPPPPQDSSSDEHNIKSSSHAPTNKRFVFVESQVVQILQRQKQLVRRRQRGLVFCVLARADTGLLPSTDDRQAAQAQLMDLWQQEQADKHGVTVGMLVWGLAKEEEHENATNHQTHISNHQLVTPRTTLPIRTPLVLEFPVQYVEQITDDADANNDHKNTTDNRTDDKDDPTVDDSLLSLPNATATPKDPPTPNTTVVHLESVQASGPHVHRFQQQRVSGDLNGNDGLCFGVVFQAPQTGVYRISFVFSFVVTHADDVNDDDKTNHPHDPDESPPSDDTPLRFSILRHVVVRAGDGTLYESLQPKTPYQKKERLQELPVAKVVPAPPPQGLLATPQNEPSNDDMKDNPHLLQKFAIPPWLKKAAKNQTLEDEILVPKYRTLQKDRDNDSDDDENENDNSDNSTDDDNDDDFAQAYSTFWHTLLWTAELQNQSDIQLFDLEDVQLQPHGGQRQFRLRVAGLAEGRPSVLRGDLVHCYWSSGNNKQSRNMKLYHGRVTAVHDLEVVLQFAPAFRHFDARLDRVQRVRFTFSRTTFRTSHTGVQRAVAVLGRSLLDPVDLPDTTIERPVPAVDQIKWTQDHLNDEQKQAVHEILRGRRRPLPYVIFGPPGTGKTTTLTEAVYHLAKVQPKLRILLVAPSNDAADILVEILSQHFPPSEMTRLLAYSRSLEQVSPLVQKYVLAEQYGADSNQSILTPRLASYKIVVATVNFAAKLFCHGGVPPGFFDVLCVDEAGHATEPEVIGPAATLLDFYQKDAASSRAQWILAGDPNQLGPVITSAIGKKFRMHISYMERLVRTSPAYQPDAVTQEYPSELVTMLVRNYRSHPAILKLPNEMFYSNKLQTCGDQFTTHSMVQWEHLPDGATSRDFPIMFHATEGENLREGNSPSWFNPQEAEIVGDYVERLAKHSRPPIQGSDIGIITPYARQVQKIRTVLKIKKLNSSESSIKVGSVETFQGQERRVIIISTVRSEQDLLQDDLKYNLGFVANRKRFNVAITRAKALVIVVGNPRVLACDKRNWLPFLRYCKEHQSWEGEDWEDEEIAADVEDEEQIDFEEVEDDDDNDDEEEGDDDWCKITDEEALGYVRREE